MSMSPLCTPATFLQLVGSSYALGYPESPSSPAPKSTTSKVPGMNITSSEAVPQGVLKPGPLGDLGIKAAPSGVSLDQGPTSSARPQSTGGVMLAPAAKTRAGASVIFPYVGAPNISLSFRAALETSPHSISLKDGAGLGVDVARAPAEESLEVPTYASCCPGTTKF
jgi:hypothetical protein